MRTPLLKITLFLSGTLIACAGPVPGPDKQFQGGVEGAVVGAGAGAVTGFQTGSLLGPAALVGAGFGAVAGSFQGFTKDQAEEDLLKLSAQTSHERDRAMVQEVLEDHYRRRLALFPTRDIYPADLFFYGDESKLRPQAKALVREIAWLNKDRLPFSRLAVVAYVKVNGKRSEYADHLVKMRSRAIIDQMVTSGLEPRRLVAKGVLIDAPLVMDPGESPTRYDQAIEIVPVDR